jgi:hypothetical protein
MLELERAGRDLKLGRDLVQMPAPVARRAQVLPRETSSPEATLRRFGHAVRECQPA